MKESYWKILAVTFFCTTMFLAVICIAKLDKQYSYIMTQHYWLNDKFNEVEDICAYIPE